MALVKTRYEPSINCFNLVRKFEGEKFKAYLCPAGKWTIGVGLTIYANGSPVRQGDIINKEQSNAELGIALRRIAAEVTHLTIHSVTLNQNQVDALIAFIYNIGITAFKKSTSLKLILENPSNPEIGIWMKKFKYGGDGQHNGKDDDGDGLIDEPGERQVLPGLIIRRANEVELYFK